MGPRAFLTTSVALLGWLLLDGCAVDAEPALPAPAPSASGAPSVPVSTSDAGGNAGAGEVPGDMLIPARIRRLSNAEYDQSVASLLGTALAPGRSFAPDARQAGFTVNEAQRVDAVLAQQLFAAAELLASEARGRYAELAPCTTSMNAETCARAFITSFGARAYRRPLVEAEAAGLLEVFRAGALDATYEDGIELVIRALVQSAGFLYLTELGAATPGAGSSATLTSHELASSLSYLVTGAPPDQALLEAAAAGTLDDAETRRSQLRRLWQERPESRAHLIRTLREWLAIDRIEVSAKDLTFYPTYEVMRGLFITESQAFIAAVLEQGSPDLGDLGLLLAADWTVGDTKLAEFYDAQDDGAGRLKLATRRGILNQGAFLSVHAHAHESAPVLRGALIARRLLCIPVAAPEALGIDVTPPVFDPTRTTRQRFEAHVANPTCAQCHKSIDALGNAFEQYDGMGSLRAMDNGSPVDSTTTLQVGADFDGTYRDSNALAEALAQSAAVQECFARHLFRAAAARSGDGASARAPDDPEDAFIAEWRALPIEKRGNVLDTLSAFVSSHLFTQRGTP